MAQLHTEPKPGEWSPNAVLAHLRACADVGGSAIQTILVQEEPTLRAVNPRKWVHEMGYLTKRFQPSLCAFAKQRAGLVSILGPLPPEAWLRSIRVTGNGRRLERSILSYGQWLANHERVHLEQLERSAKRLRT